MSRCLAAWVVELSLERDFLRTILAESEAFELDTDVQAQLSDSSLGAETLQFVGTLMKRRAVRRVLEFGSGVSTVFLSRLLEKVPGGELVSVENSSEYLVQTLNMADDAENIHLLHSPLRSFFFRGKSFVSYDGSYRKKLQRGTTFDLVLIDGPLGYRYGREAPLYQIASYLRSDSLVLLDDASRPPEQEALAAWSRVWPSRFKVECLPELKKGLAILSIENPDRMARFPFPISEITHSWRRTRNVLREMESSVC